MPTSFTITSVDYGNMPTTTQTWNFAYKLFSDPDTSYTTIGASAVVATDGTLATPLTVSGLTAGNLYYVRAQNTCEPTKYFVQAIQL